MFVKVFSCGDQKMTCICLFSIKKKFPDYFSNVWVVKTDIHKNLKGEYMKFTKWVSVVLFTLLLVSGNVAAQKINAADFNTDDLDGHNHHLYSYLEAGKYVLLDFISTG